LTKKYLAYIALLAGWICFCYWLYAKGISPQFREAQEKSWPGYSKDLPYPLNFRWGSDSPLAGPGFGELKRQYHRIDSSEEILIVRGYYFRDEADSVITVQELGYRRIHNALKYLDVNENRILTEVLPQEINADVRSNPFEAVRFEPILFSQVMSMKGDTLEMCFPLKDSIALPPICYDRLENWSRKYDRKKDSILHIVGTADGTGITESADMALERALNISDKLIKKGWSEEKIQLSTGQRNHPLTLRNRCVVVYFE
jgi:hypothetical protein